MRIITSSQLRGIKQKVYLIVLDPNIDLQILDLPSNSIVFVRESEYNISFCLSYFRNRNLKIKTPSIVSNNCSAGVCYKNLGIPFYSPTINTFIMPREFIKFCSNFKEYISTGIKFLRMERGHLNTRAYPVGLLKDIEIRFVHDTSWNDVFKTWNKRVNRIDWNNLFFYLMKEVLQ